VIFVTVGTQLAFDRMIGAVDKWAEKSGEDVFAQVGPTERIYKNIRQSSFLEPVDFDRSFNEASLVIAHAGMGSILSALSYGKPIIIMPRKASLGEHRNDHQMATARRFSGYSSISIAWDESELEHALDSFRLANEPGEGRISEYASAGFISKLQLLIHG
jgi:UDP-N-acetylglucosamine transferase subunit ALG13